MAFQVSNSISPEWTRKFDKLKPLLGSGFISGLVGMCGTGKSQMGVSLAKVSLHAGSTVCMVEAMELTDSVKDSFGGDGSSRQALYRFTGPKLLVIDEVNRGLSVFDTRLLQRVLSRRYDSMRDTVLISNESPEEFASLVGDRVMSRINDSGQVHVFGWESFRK